jgi:transcriptional regulator with XRE-family HTH domain
MFVSSLYMGNVRIDNFENLRQFVIAERSRLGMSQRDLARAGKFSASIIARLEAGQIPSIPKPAALEGIARGLRVPYEVLDRIARGQPPAVAGSTELFPELEAALADVATWPIPDQERFLAVLRAMRPAKP